MRVRASVVATLAGVAVAALAACASIVRANLAEPVVTLRTVSVTGLGLSGGSLDVVLAVYNPNGFALRTTRFTYAVFVDSTQALASGEVPTETALAARDTTAVTLPVRFTYQGVGAALAQALARGSVTYRVAGEIGVKSPFGTVTRPYSRTGTYAMRR